MRVYPGFVIHVRKFWNDDVCACGGGGDEMWYAMRGGVRVLGVCESVGSDGIDVTPVTCWRFVGWRRGYW